MASSSGSNVGSPWAATVDEVAFHTLETAVGAFCPVSMTWVGLWMMRMDDSESVGEYVIRHPKVWCDCRLARDDVSGVCVCAAGALVVARLSDDSWFTGKWGHSDVVEPVSGGHGGCCSLFGSVPGPLQTVHRAEFRSVVV